MSKRNTLSDAQKYKLLPFVQKNQQLFDENKLSLIQAASHCTNALGFIVNAANLTTLCKSAGISWTSPREPKPTMQDQINDLKKQVEYLCSQMNVELPADFPGWG